MEEEGNFNWVAIIAFILTIFGLAIIIFYLFELSNTFHVFGKGVLDIEKTGQFGDFIGGLVGSIFTLVSIILFYNALSLQRRELSSTREQMKNQTKEFEINRIINIIYKQQEIIDSKEKNMMFQVGTRNINTIGFSSIQTFSLFLSVLLPLEKNYSDLDERTKTELHSFFSFLIHNPTKTYLYAFENSVNLCIQLIDEQNKKTISVNDIKFLYHLLNNNLSIKEMRYFYSEYIRFYKTRLEYLITNASNANEPIIGMFEKQELDRGIKIQEQLSKIYNNCQ